MGADGADRYGAIASAATTCRAGCIATCEYIAGTGQRSSRSLRRATHVDDSDGHAGPDCHDRPSGACVGSLRESRRCLRTRPNQPRQPQLHRQLNSLRHRGSIVPAGLRLTRMYLPPRRQWRSPAGRRRRRRPVPCHRPQRMRAASLGRRVQRRHRLRHALTKRRMSGGAYQPITMFDSTALRACSKSEPVSCM